MWRDILGLERKPGGQVDLITPRRSFSDVILPEETRQQLYEALTQIEKHTLIFQKWGLGERHPGAMGLAFNFAGPPGTGKTICAEAVAFALGRKLLRVDYAELESCWVGETGKNVRRVFREARAANAVLFFDEADAIASRRFRGTQQGSEREANQTVNILLMELEEHPGVVIFATNMASNFDPAFARRVRTHILFRIPSVAERERIWKVQIHPDRTPLGADVDFHELAERFEVPGGDIRNAVLKAALISAAEEGADEGKVISQKHLVQAMEQVQNSRKVMAQNVQDDESPDNENSPLWLFGTRLTELEGELQACRTELGQLSEAQVDQASRLEEAGGVWEQRTAGEAEVRESVAALQQSIETLRGDLARADDSQQSAIRQWQGDQHLLAERVTAQETQLARATLIPFPKGIVAALGSLLAVLLLLAGGLASHFLR